MRENDALGRSLMGSLRENLLEEHTARRIYLMANAPETHRLLSSGVYAKRRCSGEKKTFVGLPNALGSSFSPSSYT